MAPAPGFERVELTARGEVGTLRLARAERHNALDHRALEELVEAAAWFDARPEVRVVVVAGAGPSFCGGFDVTDPGPPPGDGSLAASIDLGRVAMNAVTAMRAVTVARVHGKVRGGGVVLALSCDLWVAAADADLSLPESHLGMPIPWATLPRLVREVGPARTKEIVLSARTFTGAEAAAWGLATSTVPAAELDEAVDALVAQLVRTPPFVATSVLAEIDRLAERLGPTDDGGPDVERMSAAFVDEGCRAARRDYLERWRAGRT